MYISGSITTGYECWSEVRKLRFWWDLNPRPSDYMSDALPSALQKHASGGNYLSTGVFHSPDSSL